MTKAQAQTAAARGSVRAIAAVIRCMVSAARREGDAYAERGRHDLAAGIREGLAMILAGVERIESTVRPPSELAWRARP